jgi:hypothetical protein
MPALGHERPSHALAHQPEMQELKDVLHDVADEYEAGGCPLATFSFEVGAILAALERAGDPVWLARLGAEWQLLRAVRAEQFEAGAAELSADQLATITGVARRVRRLASE